MRNILALVRYGVPFDVAFSLDEAEILGWLVAFGEIEGHKFDWASLSWLDPD